MSDEDRAVTAVLTELRGMSLTLRVCLAACEETAAWLRERVRCDVCGGEQQRHKDSCPENNQEEDPNGSTVR